MSAIEMQQFGNAAFYSVNASDARRSSHEYNACVLWRQI